MEREQIIKALELCANEWYCGLCEFTEKECALIKKSALALINSQEQRIKELTEENECLYHLIPTLNEVKSNTVREMQERFIAEIEQTPNANEHFIEAWKSKIDQIAKEMLKENKS